MKHRGDALHGAPSREHRLRSYAGLLTSYAPRLGLLGPKDMSDIWERHVLDSLRALDCLTPADVQLVDLGSGGGLPGVPIALAAPDRHVVLLEASSRRAAFLEMVVERLALANASVLLARADGVSLQADVCLARAFASPERTWREGSRLLNPGGRVLYYAGRSWNQDVQDVLARLGATTSVCQDPEFAWQGPIVTISPRFDGI